MTFSGKYSGLTMAYEWPDDSTVVNRLLVRNAPVDETRLRLRTEGALNSVSLWPPGLSRESILCIKSLSDPLPGTLELSKSATLLPAPWGHAFALRIGEIARTASRPIREVVPANATAVVFNDRAELLASLALDQAEGELANRWWWRAIFRGSVPKHVVAKEWLEHAGSIPGALEHLARRRVIRRFVTSLDGDDVNKMLRGITVKFALTYLDPIFDSSTYPRTKTGISADASPNPAVDHETENLQLNSAVAPLGPEIPWAKWIPEIDFDDLELGERALVGVGLMLYRAPAVVRSHVFAREIIGWFRSEQMSKTSLSTGSISTSGISHGKAISGPDKESSENVTRQARQRMQPRLAAEQPSRRVKENVKFGKLPAESRPAESPIPSADSHSSAIADVGVESLPSSVQVSDRVSEPIVSGERIETELGGLFYLINVAISLGLYHDFTSPLDPGLSMPVWDFIELVGCRMLCGRYRHDLIWKLLARLAGRTERESPGMYFDPPHEWRIPPDWLEPFPGRSVWTWAANGGRLRVRHREGFYILDIDGMRNPEKHLHSELAVYSATADFLMHRGYLRPTASLPVDRWLDWIVPFILARLRSAFGLNRDVVRLLLKHRAEVVVGDERIDINLVLADLPVAIRLSGLDRDPGWIPAGGKAIAFHYK